MVARKCAVPSCLYRQRKGDKLSLFQCPKDEAKARRWAALIPGIEYLSSQQLICEKHFEKKYIKRYDDMICFYYGSRLSPDAVPTIFPNDGRFENQTTNQPVYTRLNYNYVPTTIRNNNIKNFQMRINTFSNLQMPMNANLNNCQLPASDVQTAVCNGNLSNIVQSTSPINPETSLQNVIQDLLASEQLLMDIMKEMLSYPDDGIPSIKAEKLEDDIGKVEDETKELTIYDELKNNLNHYAQKLPESWIVTQLSIGSDLVFAFSKECTVSDNQALVVMYEKSIILNSNGTVHYSIHGKTLENSHLISYNGIKDINSLFDIILKFNEQKVCKGIQTSKFAVDKAGTTYKDDLGYCRHTNCTLLTDSLQCGSCYQYS